MSKKSKKAAQAIDGSMTIGEVARKYELSDMYIRNALRAGALEGVKVPLKEGSKTNKWLITDEQVIKWRATRVTRSRRADGRSKFTLYASVDELAKLNALLVDNGIEALIERANKTKTDEGEDEGEEEPVEIGEPEPVLA